MKTTPMKPFAALTVLSLLLFVAAEAAFVSPTSSSQVKVAATHLGAEQTRRDVFATAAASCFAAAVAASTPLPAYADVTNKVASAAALRGVKRGLKDLEKTEFYAAENNYIETKSGLRSPGMNEVRKNCLVLMKGGEDNAEADSLKNSYDNFVRAIERLDSQASLGIRGKKNIELIGDYDATVKALKQFLDIAEKSAATPLQSIETE